MSFWGSSCSLSAAPKPPPNMRLKLAAPASRGSGMFVRVQPARRSLGAIR